MTKRDANEKAIVQALEAVGCTIEHLDFPCDLLVGVDGMNYLLEIKREKGPRGGQSGRKLTKTQERFVRRWRGQFALVRTPEEALSACGFQRVQGLARRRDREP